MKKEDLLTFLKKNQFEQLFPALVDTAEEQKRQQLKATILLLWSQYDELKKDQLRNVAPADQINVRYNLLREKILTIIDELDKAENQSSVRFARWPSFVMVLTIPFIFFLILRWGLQSTPKWSNFSLEAKVDYFGFRIAGKKNLAEKSDALLLDAIAVNPVSFINYSGKDVDGLDHYLNITGPVNLEELIINSDTPVSLKKDGSDLIISISQNFATGKLTGTEAQNIYLEPARPLPIPDPGSNVLEFQTAGDQADIILQIDRTRKLEVLNIPISDVLGFAEIDPTVNMPVSKLSEAHLTYENRDTVLKEQQLIEATQWRRLNLAVLFDLDHLTIQLNGEAFDLRMGYLNSTHPLLQQNRIQNLTGLPAATPIWWIFNLSLAIVFTGIAWHQVAKNRKAPLI